MSYLKEQEIKKVEEILLAKLSPPSKLKRISRKELFCEMQKIIPSLQDDQESPFCVDVSALINNGTIKGVHITRGRYGGIKLGKKPKIKLGKKPKKEDNSDTEEESSDSETKQEQNATTESKSPEDKVEETVTKAKNSYLKSSPSIKPQWNAVKATNQITLTVKGKELFLKLSLNQLNDLIKNVFLAVESTDEESNVKISIINPEFRTNKLLFVDESYLDLLERLAFYHLGAEIKF